MSRLFASFLVVGLSGFAAAQEKKADAPTLSGRWVKEAEAVELTMKFTKDTLTTVAKAGDNSITVTSKYTVDKEGKVKAEVTEVKETGTFEPKPEKGTKFTFTFKIDEKAKTAKLSDFEMPGVEGARDVVDGEYKAKKDD
jgi:hypothetical protein